MNRYPTDDELKRIAEWPYTDFPAMMIFIKALWEYSDFPGYWQQHGSIFKIHTGGWSGNEDLIGAMFGNTMFHATCWMKSERGGHYVFKVKLLK